MSSQTARRAPGQLVSVARAAHPKQALVMAVVAAALVALMGRPFREVGISALAVLLVQLVTGLDNDLADVEADRRSEVTGKPIAEGHLPPGNASFAAAVLVLLAIPMSLQNGLLAGALLLATLLVGLLHNRVLHRTPLSWLGWTVTFALVTCFVTYGGWGREADGSAPVTSFLVAMAVLGVLVHFLTSLPDLVADNASGARHLPLRVALRTGAPRLFVATVVLTVVVAAVAVYLAISQGIAS